MFFPWAQIGITWLATIPTTGIHEITRFVNRSVISSHCHVYVDQIVSYCKLPLGISLRVVVDWEQSHWRRVFNTPDPVSRSRCIKVGPLAAIWQPDRSTWRAREGTPAAGEAANVPWQSRQGVPRNRWKSTVWVVGGLCTGVLRYEWKNGEQDCIALHLMCASNEWPKGKTGSNLLNCVCFLLK